MLPPPPNPTPTPPTTTNSASSILSEKVSRALQVHTETPAMKSALDALANLSSHPANNTTSTPPTPSHTTTTTTTTIDARSVRVAIEQDALHQARLLEGELRKLVERVGGLRVEIRAVSDVAEEVCKAIDRGVVEGGGGRGGRRGGGGMGGIEEDDDDGGGGEEEGGEENEEEKEESPPFPNTNNTTAHNEKSEIEEEERLAALLANAFHEREEAHCRFEAITIFMEKYDVSENDSYLLDHYNFENVFDETPSEPAAAAADNGNGDTTEGGEHEHPPAGGGGGGGMKDGMAFLDALERVSKIRQELATSFHLSPTTTSPSSPSSQPSSLPPPSSHLGATSALRMMENLASKQERAYERLYRFLHDHLDLHSHVPTSSHTPTSSFPSPHHLPPPPPPSEEEDDRIDQTLTNPILIRSLRLLRAKPSYYTHTLELIASVRRSGVTRKFLMALTSGWDGMAPMEMKAHDPVNYVGDMLAFVFRTISVESVLSEGLARVGVGDGGGEEGYGEEEVGGGMSAVDVLNDTMGGVARPLRSRISQVVMALARREEEEEEGEIGGGRILGVGSEEDGGLEGGGGGIGAGMGGVGVLEEEASSARVRLCSIYSICGLLLYYYSAVKKAVNRLQPPKNQKSIEAEDGGDDDTTIDPNTTEEEEPPSQTNPNNNNNDISKTNPIIRCLITCIEEATQSYATSLKVYNALLPHYASPTPSTPSPTTTPAEIAHAAIERLCHVRTASPGFDEEILRSFENSVVGVGETSSPVRRGGGGGGVVRTEMSVASIEFYLGLEYLCDTVVQGILPPTGGGGGGGGRKSPRERLDDVGHVQMAINVAKKAGLGLTAVARWNEVLSEISQGAVEELIVLDAEETLDGCGLGLVRKALVLEEGKKRDEGGGKEEGGVSIEGIVSMERQRRIGGGGLERESIERAVKTFYGCLEDMPFPSYEGVKDPSLRRYARTELAKKVGEVYREIYELVLERKQGGEEKDKDWDLMFLEHTPDAIMTLLSS